MKNIIKLFTLIACLVLPAAYAQGYTITDDYWGGTVQNSGATSYGDVIGYPNFAVDTMDVTVNSSSSQMTVTLTGNYFKTNEVKSWGPGDLYISTSGWKTSDGLTSGHHEYDTFLQSEGWNYVVSNRDISATTDKPAISKGAVYNLVFSSEANPPPYPIVYTNTAHHPGSWVYRANQAYWGGYGKDPVGQGSVFLDSMNGTLQFTFDISWMNNNSNWQNWGFHWNMQCGNDVVEGRTPVPEPSTLLLLGSGMVGLIGFRRKFKK